MATFIGNQQWRRTPFEIHLDQMANSVFVSFSHNKIPLVVMLIIFVCIPEICLQYIISRFYYLSSLLFNNDVVLKNYIKQLTANTETILLSIFKRWYEILRTNQLQ